MIRFGAVPLEKLDPVWKRLDPLYTDACNKTHGALTKDVVLARAKAGICTLWIAADDETQVLASCVTSMVDFPTGLRVLFVEMLAGPQKYLVMDFSAALERHAAEKGCGGVFMLTSRHARDKAPTYKQTHIILFKGIADQ